MKVLNIVASGYRATLEEQDDTIVWLMHAIKGAGADVNVLLRGPAANYVVRGQEVSPLTFGSRTQKNAPDVHGQLEALIGKGVGVYVIEEDLLVRGVVAAARLEGITVVPSNGVGDLISQYDQVWHW
jgi:hypothetical protein